MSLKWLHSHETWVPHGMTSLKQAIYSLQLIFTFYHNRDTSVLELFLVIVKKSILVINQNGHIGFIWTILELKLIFSPRIYFWSIISRNKAQEIVCHGRWSVHEIHWALHYEMLRGWSKYQWVSSTLKELHYKAINILNSFIQRWLTMALYGKPGVKLIKERKPSTFNSLRLWQNRCHFAHDVFKCNSLNENVWIPIKISLKFVPQGPINNIPVLVQIMAWCQPGDKQLSGPRMESLLTHIYASLGLNELSTINHDSVWLLISLGNLAVISFPGQYCDYAVVNQQEWGNQVDLAFGKISIWLLDRSSFSLESWWSGTAGHQGISLCGVVISTYNDTEISGISIICIWMYIYSAVQLWCSHYTPAQQSWRRGILDSLYPRPTKLEEGYTGFIIPPPNKVGGGVYWIHLVRPSVRLSVRPSLCRRHGFRSISQVSCGISISNFICMLMVAIGRSLLIFSDVTFKMAAWRPYWIFWFPDSNFTLALNINFKLQRHNTYVYG